MMRAVQQGNKVTLWVMWLFCVSDLFMLFSLRIEQQPFILKLGGIFVVPLLVVSILHLKKANPIGIMYTTSVGLSLLWGAVLSVDPDPLNELFIFFILALSSVYRHTKNILVSFFTLLPIHIYVFFRFKEQVFTTDDGLGFTYTSLIFIGVGVSLLFQSLHGNRLLAEVVEKQKKAEQSEILAQEALQLATVRRASLLSAATHLESHVKGTSFSLETVRHSFDEMSQAFGEQAEALFRATKEVSLLSRDTSDASQRIDAIQANVDQAKKEAFQSSHYMEELHQYTEEVHAALKQTESTSRDLGMSMKNIQNMLDMIEQVANKTHLLSLNAAIESARSENGSSFGVIATEIRKLAEHTKESSQTIRQVIAELLLVTEQNQQSVQHSFQASSLAEERAERVKQSLGTVASYSASVSEEILHIRSRMQSLETSLRRITEQTETISSTAEENNAELEELYQSVAQIQGNVQQISKDFSALQME